jgi:ferredoxin
VSARLHVDWTGCEARGACLELLPHLLDADDWGYPMARGGSRDAAVDERDLADAEDAVRLCPRMALTLQRSRPA